MKDTLKIAFVYVGTIVGAGLASGQEILQFFSQYGLPGFLGILLCGLIYILISIVIVDLCYCNKYKSYREIVEAVFGSRFGWIVDIFLTFFIFGGNTIMLSGGGAMLNEFLGFNKYWGIILMAILVFFITAYSTKGIVNTNAIIVPLSSTLIIILGILVFLNLKSHNLIPNSPISINPIKNSWGFSSILYSAFNLMVATGVLCPIIAEGNVKKTFVNGCIIGSILLIILMLTINFSILSYFPDSFKAEIPNLYIARKFGAIFPILITIIIWLEMLSTEIGNLYSLAKRFQYSLCIPYIHALIGVLLLSLPFTLIGFSNLIKILYPPFGAISLIFLIGCIYKQFSIK